jgi:hypothetical protein
MMAKSEGIDGGGKGRRDERQPATLFDRDRNDRACETEQMEASLSTEEGNKKHTMFPDSLCFLVRKERGARTRHTESN